MNRQLKCPYCKTLQDLEASERWGEAEKEHEKQCHSCNKIIVYKIQYFPSYYTICDSHNMKKADWIDDLWNCERCDYYEFRSKEISGAM